MKRKNHIEFVKRLNDETLLNEAVFREYGIDLKYDSAILVNDKWFRRYLCLSISLFLAFMGLFWGMFFRYYKTKEKRVKEIIKDIEQINHGNYSLDLEDNSEDELSILKNELYKTTVMLKEVAENSIKDKIGLKDSLSDISHQLKTPLTSISILLENLIEGQVMEEKIRNEFLKDIKREVTNIQFLVETLLKLSKFDSNCVKFVKKEVKIQKLVQEALKNVEILCELKRIKIKTIGNDRDQLVCDPKWQIEALTNILKNCMEHSTSDSELEIIYEQNKVYSQIKIRDNGMGIDEQDLPHIFERFYKGKNSSYESMGIGLALAKSIIEEDNGYIGVESELGKGSIFTIKYLMV